MDSTCTKKYLLIPIPKNPYYRVGPLAWQDYYRQLVRTVDIAAQLKATGNEVVVGIISAFQPSGRPSEVEIYSRMLHDLEPGLAIRAYSETNDTVGQIERSLDLALEIGATPVFVTTWMHYPRVRYLARGRPALHFGALGVPQPLFMSIDPFCLIFQPIGDALGITDSFRRVIIREREQGRIL